MSGRGRGKKENGEKKRWRHQEDGFEDWGNYMAAKRAKLLDQFHAGPIEKESDIFAGIKIMTNGLTNPPASELKDLMSKHGGEWHMYKSSATTHIIASNLPNTKIKHLGAVPIVKPAWIVESIALGKLLDYRRYLLYTNQSSKQPALNLPVLNKNCSGTAAKLASPNVSEEYSINIEVKGSAECTPSKNDGSDVELFSDDDDILMKNIHRSTSDTNEHSVNKNKPETSHSQTYPTTQKNDSVTKASSENVTTSKNPTSRSPSKVTKTASDPRFLEEFYNNSRLHLISTLGAEFKQLVGQLREKSDGRFPGREKLKQQKGNTSDVSLPDSVVMHIDMDCFFVSVGLRNHPELRGKPVAITHAKSGTISTNDPVKEAEKQANRNKEFEMYTERLPEGAISRVVDIKDKIDGLASMSEIASCSYEARKCGIKNGMFMGHAIKLCPDLKTLPYDFEGYKDVSNILYKTVASYTLDIEAVSCDEMYVDIKPILVETGLTVAEWANHIRSEIMAVTGCPCSTGFGANRLQARLATRKAKPAGQYYLKPDDVQDYMSKISLEDLPGVGRATLAKLRSLGLATCGDVQNASLKLLQSELGNKIGEKIMDQSFGRDSNPLNFHHERKSVSAEINYGIRFKSKEECYNFLMSLSNEVFNRLTDIKMKSRCLTLKLLVRAEGAPVETAKFLGHGVCDSLSKSVTTNHNLADANAIFREAKALYDKLNIPFAELRGVGIQLNKLEKNAPVNKTLCNFLKQGLTKPKTEDNSININNNSDPQNNLEEKDVEITKNVKKGRVTPDPQLKLTDFLPNINGDKLTIIETTNNVKTTSRTPIKIGQKPDVKATSKSKSSNAKSKGGRGRPKGSKSASNPAKKVARNLSQNVNMMESFLGIKPIEKKNLGEIPEESPQALEHIDMDVFKQLPIEIQKEVMREYHFRPTKVSKQIEKVDQNQTEKVSKDAVKSHVKIKKNEVIKQSGSAGKKTQSSPFENLSWDEIKEIVKVWISSETEPNDSDVDMLGKHFRQLALDRKIEVLKCIFNFLHRVFTNLGCLWHKAYFTFVNIMQTGMVEQYGLVLLVNTNFSCCQLH